MASHNQLKTGFATFGVRRQPGILLFRTLFAEMLIACAESEGSQMPVIPVRIMLGAAVAASTALSGAHGLPHAAASPRNKLTFRVIDRAGHLVKPLDLQLLNLASGTNIDLGQGTKCLV